ncbi:hypothetical protein B0H11DRAFT_2258642 [Mycena galericulata]|nr:hypothetical protein B0H11DRAFT_2258642 [Mycena galericulata]
MSRPRASLERGEEYGDMDFVLLQRLSPQSIQTASSYDVVAQWRPDPLAPWRAHMEEAERERRREEARFAWGVFWRVFRLALFLTAWSMRRGVTYEVAGYQPVGWDASGAVTKVVVSLILHIHL